MNKEFDIWVSTEVIGVYHSYDKGIGKLTRFKKPWQANSYLYASILMLELIYTRITPVYLSGARGFRIQ